MLFLPAAALCCLCSALAAMATQLSQDDLTLTRREGQSVSFSCGGMDQCASDVTWYQKKDTETFKAILYIYTGGSAEKPFNHPQKNDFSAEKNQNDCKLKISKVKPSHSASYYCGCVKDGTTVIGSGTRLYVSDEKVVKPVVSVYPAASRAHLEGKSSLLCLASDMFPPLVQISWKRQKKDGDLEDLPPVEGEQLELRESGRTASILLVDRQENGSSKYSCSVQHEGGRVEAQTLQELPAPAASCPPERPDLAALQQADLSFQSQCRVKLLCLLYTVLIVKSLVYCCGLSLLMMLRTKGPSTI
ncbi:immunoglobulin lambda-1 light chain-like [Girardinichthys multiradiatus]|uniref:immunoglobulin lambda-1 light chain-like n=1 Tax=Girardinichthys multiradiatus TaxID=208333 RepID=UPI001FAD4831|nr:immunoglobulin lambda-1 light chain-like [Girardinichthys multiradiatus]